MFMNDYKEVHKKYQNLIYKVVNRYPAIHQEDLYQEACIALNRAWKTWSSEGNANFMTWAYVCMNHACSNYMKRYALSIRVPLKYINSFEGCVSLNAEIFEDITLDSIVSGNSEQYDDTVQAIDKMLRRLVHKHVMTQTDLDILHLRYRDNMTLEGIGSLCGITGSAVGRKIKVILYKIRPYFIRSLSRQFICL